MKVVILHIQIRAAHESENFAANCYRQSARIFVNRLCYPGKELCGQVPQFQVCICFEYCENDHKTSLTASGDKRPWLRRGRWSRTSPLELIVIVDELLEIIAAESRDSPDHDTTSSSSSAATRPAGWWSLNLPDSLDRPLNILLELARWNLIPHQLLL